jgi:hypothetical protein
VRYGEGENNEFQAHSLPYVTGVYRGAEEEAVRYGEKRAKTKL